MKNAVVYFVAVRAPPLLSWLQLDPTVAEEKTSIYS